MSMGILTSKRRIGLELMKVHSLCPGSLVPSHHPFVVAAEPAAWSGDELSNVQALLLGWSQ